MQGVKETLCSRCLKRQVCKYLEDFMALIKKTDMIDKNDIHSIEVKCAEWIANQNYRSI